MQTNGIAAAQVRRGSRFRVVVVVSVHRPLHCSLPSLTPPPPHTHPPHPLRAQPNGKSGAASPPPAQQADALPAPHSVEKLGPAPAPPVADATPPPVAGAGAAGGGKPNPALIGSQLFTSFLG